MKIAILGYGAEGRSAYEYFCHQPAVELTICDSNVELQVPAGVGVRLGPDYLDDLDNFDLIIRSPGVLPSQLSTTSEVSSVTNEFLARVTVPVIGVTGTKGKGTTAALIHHMLKAAGRSVWLGGNIGTPPLDFLSEITPSDFVVLELSNLQLWDCRYSPRVAVLLMITPEHLDWHEGKMENYVATKAQITAHQSENDRLYYRADNPYTAEIAASSQAQTEAFMDSAGAWVDGEVIKYRDQAICRTDEVKLVGRHNLDNVCAAIAAVWQFVPDPAVLRAAISSYSGLPHRLQYVATVEGVDYYDDSIGTTPEAAMAAVRAFTAPKVLIMGGSSKGADYQELARELAQAKLRTIIVMGDTATQLQSAFVAAGVSAPVTAVEGSNPMGQALAFARAAAQPGDVVLLAPACASFGLFQNYQDRGQQFQAAIAAAS